MNTEHLQKVPDAHRIDILIEYYSDPTATLESLGKKYGVTRERIRQIRNKELRKIKAACARGRYGKLNFPEVST